MSAIHRPLLPSLLTPLLTLWLAGSLAAASTPASRELLFVFEDSGAVEILDAETLAPHALASIGARGRSVYGWSGGGISRYFVVAESEVVLLDAEFGMAGRLALGATTPAAAPAVMTLTGDRLIVAAGARLFLIDTERGEISSQIEAPGEIAGVALSAGGGSVFVLVEGETALRSFDPASGAWNPSLIGFSTAPRLVGGSGGVTLASSAGEVFDLSQLDGNFSSGSSTTDESATAAAVNIAAVSGAGSWLAIDGGRAVLQTSEGYSTTLADDGGDPLDGAAIAGAAFGSDSAALFVALAGTDRLLAYDSSGRMAGAAALSGTPQAVAVAPEPVEQGGVSVLKVAGDQQVIASGAAFDLVVSVPFPAGVPMQTSANPNVVSCDPPLLVLETVIPCVAAEVAVTTQTVVTVDAGPLGSVDFTVLVFPSSAPDGLFKVSGDNQTVGGDGLLKLVAEYRVDGAPAVGAPLSVVSAPAGLLSCPASTATSIAGLARIICTTASVATQRVAIITVSTGTGVPPLTFGVTIIPGIAGNGLSKASPDPLSVSEGDDFELLVDAADGGVPQAGLEITASVGVGAVSCPSSATTNDQGRAMFRCSTAAVEQTQSGSITLQDGVRTATFDITVFKAGEFDGIAIVSGNGQIVPRNSTAFPLPLVVSAFVDGEPQVNKLLSIVPDRAGEIFCPVNVRIQADGLGEFDCGTAFVPGDLPVRIDIVDTATGRRLPERFSLIIAAQDATPADDLELLSDEEISAVVGTRLEDAVRVRAVDGVGDDVTGAAVFFRSSQGLTFEPAASTTNFEGLASTDVIFSCPRLSGTIQVGRTKTIVDQTIAFTASPGPFANLAVFQGDNQTGAPGELLNGQALIVRATDECGNALQHVPVLWTADPPDAATLENIVGQTDGLGRSSVLVRLGNRGGPLTVTARSGDLVAVFNVTVRSAPANLAVAGGDGQRVPSGSQAVEPLTVRLTNGQGGPVPGVEVSFAVTSGGGSVAPGSATTNAAGEAAVTVQVGGSLGAVVVQATTAAGLTTEFNLFSSGRVPTVAANAIVNAGSFAVGLTPGGAATIFGSHLMEGVDGVFAAPFNNGFPLEFRGVSVRVAGLPAPILGVANVNGQEQINIQVPFGIQPGTAAVVVTNNGSSTTISGVSVLARQPGFFEISLEGGRFAAALHADFSLVTPSNPARPGEIILLFFTGFGETNPPLGTNVVGPSSPLIGPAAEVVVGVDNAGVRVLGTFYAPSLITVYQVNIEMPSSLPAGTVELTVLVGGASGQATALPTAP